MAVICSKWWPLTPLKLVVSSLTRKLVRRLSSYIVYMMWYWNITHWLVWKCSFQNYTILKQKKIFEYSLSNLQGSYSFEHLKFHDFPWLFKVFNELHLTILLGNFQKLSWFWVRFYPFPHKDNLPNIFSTINTIFYDFPWPTLNSMIFRPGKWNSKIPRLSRFSMTRTNPELIDTCKESNWNNSDFHSTSAVSLTKAES